MDKYDAHHTIHTIQLTEIIISVAAQDLSQDVSKTFGSLLPTLHCMLQAFYKGYNMYVMNIPAITSK